MDTDIYAPILHKLQAHPALFTSLCVLLGLSIVASKFVAPRWPIPPKDANVFIRVIHFVVVNWPAWGYALAGEVKSIIPGAPVPFLSFTARPVVDPVEQARVVLNEPPAKKADAGAIDLGILLCIGLIGFVVAAVLAGGCSYDKGYVRALQVKGELSEGATIVHEGWRKFDSAYHDNLLANSTSYVEGVDNLHKWQKGPERRVDIALKAWRDALKSFREALNAPGAAKRGDWTALTVAVIAAATEAITALTDAGVPVEWKLPGASGTSPSSWVNDRAKMIYLACAQPPGDILAPSICAPILAGGAR